MMTALAHLRAFGSNGFVAPVAALDFDFLAGEIDPRLTCVRDSLASCIGATGLMTFSPHNLCINSEQISFWSRENVSAFGAGSITDGVQAPDGAMTGDVIHDGAASGRHIVYSYRAIPGPGVYLYSVCLKDLGRRYAQVYSVSIGNAAGAAVYVDLELGVVTQTRSVSGNAQVLSSGISSLGDGWWRVWVCFPAPASVSGLYVVVGLTDRPTESSGPMFAGSPSYAGSGQTLGVWGAQLELVGDEREPRTYVRSTGAPTHGPRIDFDPVSLAPRGLLIEEARTNLVLNSQTPVDQTVPVAAKSYTLSFFGSGSVALSGAASAQVSGLGDYPARQAFTFTPAAGALSLAFSGDVRFVQCEQGAFATSWIPTWGGAQARAADDIGLASSILPDLLSLTAGSFLVEASRFTTTQRGDVMHLGRAANPALAELDLLGAEDGALVIAMSGVSTAFAPAFPSVFASSAVVRVAVAYGGGEGAVAVNGSAPASGSGVLDLSQADAMKIGSNAGAARHYLNGHVRRIRHYRELLSDRALRKLST